MRINEILVESKLDEGPLGSLAKAAGRGVGNVIGGVAGAAGAVKGAVKGAVDRAKSSFKAGEKGAYDTLAGKPAAAPAANQTQANLAKTGNPVGAPSDQAEPASAKKPGVLKQIGQAVGDFKAGFQQGSGNPPARAPAAASQAPAKATPAASTDQAAPTQPAANPKADTAYAQAQKAIAGLAPEQKKQLITAIQSDPKVKAAIDKPAAKKPAAKKPAAAAQKAPAAATADAPINPATGKPLTEPERQAHQDAGGQFDGETGAPLPLGTKAVNPSSDFEKKVADLKAKRDAEKAAKATAAPAPAAAPAEPSTAQAAAQAQQTGGDAEQAALAAMQQKNPNLAKLMAKDKKPVQITGKKSPPAQKQVAGLEPKPNMVAEGFSIFRKH